MYLSLRGDREASRIKGEGKEVGLCLWKARSPYVVVSGIIHQPFPLKCFIEMTPFRKSLEDLL